MSSAIVLSVAMDRGGGPFAIDVDLVAASLSSWGLAFDRDTLLQLIAEALADRTPEVGTLGRRT